MTIPDLLTLLVAWLAVGFAVDWIWFGRPKPKPIPPRQEAWLCFECNHQTYMVHFHPDDPRSLYDALERFAMDPELDFDYRHMAAVADEMENAK